MEATRISKIGRPLAILILITMALPVFAQFGGGSGTAQDPYLVQTAAHLNSIRSNRTAHFLQTNSIDLNIAPYNQGVGWDPIGLPATPFAGSYDGGDFTITGLYINRSYSLGGLFGFTSNAEITRLRLVNANISADTMVGSLVGNGSGTYISICLISASLSGSSSIGGLAGIMEDCIVSECQVVVSINSSQGISVGGLCGMANDCEFNACQASGTCSGDMSVGGLCGDSSGTSISNSYSSIDLSGQIWVGGLVGQMSSGSMINAYYNGSIAIGSDAGGLIGSASAVSVNHSYWNTQVSGVNTSDGGEGRTTAQMTYPYSSNTYVSWDFVNVWTADSTGTENEGYPYLQTNSMSGTVDAPGFSHAGGYYSEPFMLTLHASTYNSVIYFTLDGSEPTTQSSVYTTPLAIAETTTIKAFASRPGWVPSNTITVSYYLGMFGGGSGTSADPYLISTPEQLFSIRYAMDACFKQTQDIDMNVAPFNTGSGWSPIGFANDQGYAEFSGDYNGDAWRIINLYVNTTNTYTGLFGRTSGADLRNISLVNVSINGGSYTGGLVGYCTGTTIDRCSVNGIITGDYTVGGLFGFLGSSDASNCFSRAAVSGSTGVGGFIGHLYISSIVTNCYSTGLVTCNGSDRGGLIGGATLTDWTVSSSYWDIITSGQNASVAGLGKTTDEMTYPYAPDCYVTWNFTNIWTSDVQGINDGYPFFYRRVQMPIVTHPTINPEVPVLITMQCTTAGATIYYTLDDSTPDANSALYLEPFLVYCDADSTVTVQAIALRDGFIPSAITVDILDFSTGSGSDNEDEHNPAPVLGLNLYPNPARQGMNVMFSLPKSTVVGLSVYNIKGQLVRTLDHSTFSSGEHTLVWDRKDNRGIRVRSGVYFIRLDAGQKSYTRKLLMVD